MSVRKVKPQISLCIRPVWSESSQCAHWVIKNPIFLHVESEDSDNHELMSRVIWVLQMSQCMGFQQCGMCDQQSLRSEPLLVAWVFYDCKATDWTSVEVSKLKRRLHRLVWVYTCQNAILLVISCHGSNSVRTVKLRSAQSDQSSLCPTGN